MPVQMKGLQAAQVDDLLQFSRATFGERSYQGTSRYLRWLYEANPYSKGLDDCLLALDDGAVVGCMHRMRLPCAGASGIGELTSLQNHIVAPDVRSGVGLMLLRRSAREADVALSPGVNARLAVAYRQLGHAEVPTHWLWKPVRPLKGAAQLALVKALPQRREGAAVLDLKKARAAAGEAIRLAVRPDEAALAAMAQAMTIRYAGPRPYVAWTPDLVRWRYFSDDGPASLLVGTPGSSPWAVLSYGVRNGLSVARLMEYEEEEGDPALMAAVVRAARAVGAAVLFGYTTEESTRARLLDQGWRVRKDPPFSFVLNAPALSVGAAATDVGFEALATKIAA